MELVSYSKSVTLSDCTLEVYDHLLEFLSCGVAFRALGLPWHTAMSNGDFRFRCSRCGLAAYIKVLIEGLNQYEGHSTEVESSKTKRSRHHGQ